jgi:DNA polymerase III subunit beta
MKLICTQENFKKSIFNTERITSKQITLPILGNILLETKKGRLCFSATNLELGVISTIGAKIEKEGKITVPARLLSSFINNLPLLEEKIILETEDHTLKIISGSYKAKIKGLDAQEFPIIPIIKDEYLLDLPATQIKEAISRILVCVSPNEARPELLGVNILFSENEISLAATDSFRLAEEKITLNNKNKGTNYSIFISKTSSIIIPANTLSEILKIIDVESEQVKVFIEENQISFEIGDVYVISRLINGKYPEYKQIIPHNFSTRVVLVKEDILRAVRIASAFTSNKSGEVNFKIDAEKKQILIKSQSQETGENTTELKADITGPNQEVIFNPRFILDGINSIPASQVALLINSNTSPIALKIINEKDGKLLDKYTYIAMPIKM